MRIYILKSIKLLLLLTLLVSCGGNKDTSDCDSAQGSGGVFNDNRYDCPTGDPSNDDIQLDSSNYLLGELEAGYSIEKIINIKNRGDAKIFDFNISITEGVLLQNSCPTKLLPEDECAIKIKIEDTLAGEKTGLIQFSDKTGLINKTVPYSYNIIPSYPVNKDIIFNADQFLSFNNLKVNIGPLKDRFGNVIEDPIRITSSRIVSINNLNFQTDPLSLGLDVNGNSSYYLKSNSLDGNQLVDNVDVNMEIVRNYTDPSIGTISKEFSISFLNNKPRISTSEQLYSVTEDIVQYPLINLTEGEDYRGLPVSYQLTQAPSKGVISNCLQGNDFVTLVTCVYTPNPNFNGEDTFKYKAYNGEALSFEEAVVKITVNPVNDAPVLSGEFNRKVLEGQQTEILLPQGFDVDGDSLTYVITRPPQKGSFACDGRTCSFQGQSNLVDNNDYFQYKVRDPSGEESGLFRYNLLIENVNEKPELGGNESHATNEDTPVSFTLTPGTDVDAGDVLVYRIKNQPQKGRIENCLNNNQDLTCDYIPNPNVDNADSFTYVAVDKAGLESEPRNVTITITQENDPPFFSSKYQEVQVIPGNAVNFNVLSAQDPEGNSVIHEEVEGIVVNNDTLVCIPQLTCSYTPAPGVTNETKSFKYRARDQLGAYSEDRLVKIIISSIKNPPTLTGSLSVDVDEDTSLEFNLIQGNDTETPQEFLEYFIASVNPQNGEIRDCMDLPGSDGDTDFSCTYIPNENYVGIDQFSYSVADGGGQSSTELVVNISVNQVNDAPVFSESEVILNVDEDFAFPFNLSLATDLENDSITYSLESGPSFGVVSGDCFSNNQNQCVYLSDQNYYGEDSFTIKAMDENGLSSVLVYKINISNINDAPSLGQGTLAFSVDEDSLSDIALVEATDIDTQKLNIAYRLSQQPEKGVLSNCLGIDGVEGVNCKYLTKSNETGIDSFKYKATDFIDESEEIEVFISISDVNDEPFFSRFLVGPYSVEQEVPFQFPIILANDLENDNLSYEIVTPPTKGQLNNCFDIQDLNNCYYVANENETGEDYIIYRAKDLSNNSYNEVQVSFNIEEAKYSRIFSLKSNGPTSKPDSIVLDDKVYKVGSSYVYNVFNGITNGVSIRNIDKNSEQFATYMTPSYSISYNNEVFVFTINTTKKEIRVFSEKGLVSFVKVPEGVLLSNPIVFNNNIYWGSNSSTLYRLNLTKIGNENKYYIDKVTKMDDFSINLMDRSFSPMTVINNELFFKYRNDNNLWSIAKINIKGEVELVSTSIGKSFNQVKQSLVYDNEDNLKRLFITVEEEGKQGIYVYDYLQSDSNDRFYRIGANKTLQETLERMMLFKSRTQDFIVFRDGKSNKPAYLRPDLLIIDYFDVGMETLDLQVSADNQRLFFINNNTIKLSDDNPIVDLKTVNLNFPVEKSISIFANRLLLKKLDGYFVINDGLAVSKVKVPSEFNYSSLGGVFENEALLWSEESGDKKIYVFKENFLYDMGNNTTGFIDGLVGDSSFGIISNLLNGEVSNCLGDNGINDLECNVQVNTDFFGIDNFSYEANVNGELESFSVKLKINNSKPQLDENISKKIDLLTLSSDYDEIIDYIVLKDQFYLSVREAADYNFYKLYKDGNKLLIHSSESPINILEAKDKYVFYVDKSLPNKIYRYNQATANKSLVFEDLNGLTMEVDDIYINNSYVYYMVKNYGNPARDRLIKQQLVNNNFEEIALPSGLLGGKFFPINNGFYVVSLNNFAFFNEENNTFVNTQISSRDIDVELSSSIDNYLYLIVENPSSNNELNIRVFDTDENIYLETSYFFDTNRIILNENITLNKGHLLKLNAGSPYLYLIEADVQGLSEQVEVILVREKDRFVPATEETPLSTLFRGTQNFNSNVKNIEDEYYFISRNEDDSIVSFNKIGYKNYVDGLYLSQIEFKLGSFIDKDNDSLNYEINNLPQEGVITDCIGLNGSELDDLNCIYTHTGDILEDSFSYRVFDGKEYSDIKVINFNIVNQKPYFNNTAPLVVDLYKNIPSYINLESALDFESNNLYFVVDTLPTKGTITGCIFDENNLILSSDSCLYTPNTDIIGDDFITYYVTDGNKRTESKRINIEILNISTPVFTESMKNTYISKNNSGSVLLKLPKAQDPSGQTLSYEIVDSPTQGVLSNCLADGGSFLTCEYTPNNLNTRVGDGFTFRAYNGTEYSDNINVNIVITGSNIEGSLGDLTLGQQGPKLILNNTDNLTVLSSLDGYSWNNINKELVLPANISYDFNSIEIQEGFSIRFKPVDENGFRTEETSWTRIYSQSTCIIDGEINVEGGYSEDPEEDILLEFTDIDGITMQHLIPKYTIHGFGGRGGGSSSVTRISGTDYGTPTFFRGAEGQIGVGDSGTNLDGGLRGYDGGALLLKCLDSIEGSGILNVQGLPGENGEKGRDGGRNDITMISFGGGGGSAAGNGGHGGSITLVSDDIIFNGDSLINGGDRGLGGLGGSPDFIYTTPYFATQGSIGADGIDGEIGDCNNGDLSGFFTSCIIE